MTMRLSSLLSSGVSITIILSVVVVVLSILVFYGKWLKRYIEWQHNSLITGVSSGFVVYFLSERWGGSCIRADNADEPICFLNSEGLGDFYVSCVTLGIALIAALYAAHVIYYNKVSQEEESLSKLDMTVGQDSYIKNIDYFNSIMKSSCIASIFVVFISMINLFFNLEDVLILHSAAFGIFIMAVMYSARVFMMSLSLKNKYIF